MSARDDHPVLALSVRDDYPAPGHAKAALNAALDEIDRLRSWQREACEVLQLGELREFEREMRTAELLREAGQ